MVRLLHLVQSFKNKNDKRTADLGNHFSDPYLVSIENGTPLTLFSIIPYCTNSSFPDVAQQNDEREKWSSYISKDYISEIFYFSVWNIGGIGLAVQFPLMWFVFWKYACHLGSINLIYSDDSKTLQLFSIKVLALWLTWASFTILLRRTYYSFAPLAISSITKHFELFLLAGLTVTISANICSMIHTPAEPLFDIGFILIPALDEHSALRSLSDILAQSLPAVLILRSFWLGRQSRCHMIVNWLRCVSLAYIFRALTVVLTSLPGPAPHCTTAESYNPPNGWHDIATRLGPMVGNYTTCGDLIFSGHTAFTTMTMLCIVKSIEGNRNRVIASFLGTFYVLTMATLAIAGRKHYSIDVAVALLVSLLTFHRFQDGWVARPLGKGMSDEQFRIARKDTMEYSTAESSDAFLRSAHQSTSSSQLVMA